MNKFLKTMKRFGYISIETVIVAAIMIVAIFTFLGSFVERGQTASNDAASKIDDVLNLAGGGEGAGPGGSGGGAGGGGLPETPEVEPFKLEAGLYETGAIAAAARGEDSSGMLKKTWQQLIDEGAFYYINNGYVSVDMDYRTELAGDLVLSDDILTVNSFSECTNLTGVYLPDSVKTIEDYAFRGCTSLSEIDLSNVETIDSYAFWGCTNLSSVTLGVNVTTINNYSFQDCTNLTEIDLSNVTTIGQSAFQGCKSLSSVGSTANLTTIGEQAFQSCQNLTEFDLSNVTTIKGSAFSGCKFTEIDLSNAETIGFNAFGYAANLTSVTLGKKLTTISGSAFQNCKNLKDVYYAGSADDWANVTGTSNIPSKATIHFESTGPSN